MASKLLLFAALLSFAATLVQARGRGGLSLGNTYGSRLIYHETHHKFPIPLIKRDEDFTVHADNNSIISGIVISDLEGKGSSYIKSGGVGQRSVTIHLSSERGEGYKFLVNVYVI